MLSLFCEQHSSLYPHEVLHISLVHDTHTHTSIEYVWDVRVRKTNVSSTRLTLPFYKCFSTSVKAQCCKALWPWTWWVRCVKIEEHILSTRGRGTHTLQRSLAHYWQTITLLWNKWVLPVIPTLHEFRWSRLT